MDLEIVSRPGAGGDPELEIDGPNPWQTLGTRVLWEDRYRRIRQDDVIQPDGARTQYSYIEPTTEFVVIVPVSAHGTTFLVRQWRLPWSRNSWEAPAGTCEPGEPPLNTAKRELAEEAGLMAETWIDLGISFNSAAFSKPFHIFLAQGLTAVEATGRDGSERDMIVREIPFEAAFEAAANGTILHAASVTAILRAHHALAGQAELEGRDPDPPVKR